MIAAGSADNSGDEIEKFLNHGLAVRAAPSHGVGRAMGEVVAHEIAGNGMERFSRGGDLRDDVGTIAVLLDHDGDAADLPFDAAKLLEVGLFDGRIDGDGAASAARPGLA